MLKCRPPGNRNPEADEVARCEGFLHEQIRLSRPDCILLLGRFAAQSVLQSELPIGRLRNRLHHITLDGRRIPVVVTYHPALDIEKFLSTIDINEMEIEEIIKLSMKKL